MRYRTIVADPPWHYEGFVAGKGGRWADGTAGSTTRSLPYGSLTVEDIAGITVADWTAPDARLFLWTTNRYLPSSFGVLTAWGFEYRQALVWRKTGNPTPWGGHIAPNHAEFLLVAVRGRPERLGRLKSSVLSVDTNPARLAHSQKPEAFLDFVEQVSPGPYLEMFARRARFGWDYYGDESLGTVELAS